jgi:hypothetical protein
MLRTIPLSRRGVYRVRGTQRIVSTIAHGLFGILLAAREGLEVNLLGVSLGVDPVRPALKPPALGRLGMAGL